VRSELGVGIRMVVIFCLNSLKPVFPFFFHFSALDNRPKSSSPIRLPEISGGQTNRTAEAEPQSSKLTNA
jgi:hypothetical protein